jgi:predicted thioesterase
MQPELQPGIKNQFEKIVEEQHTATHVGSGNAAVLATPVMIAFMEGAAMDAVQPLLPAGSTTVGIHVDVRHIAATPLGMKVTIRAELIKVEGRALTFQVSADDEKERVGEGTHQRAIIDIARFQERVKAKAAGIR